MKKLDYEVGTVGVDSDVSTSSKRGSVSSGYMISQHRVASTVSWLHAMPSSCGWLGGM